MFNRRIGMLVVALVLAGTFFQWNIQMPSSGVLKSSPEFVGSERWMVELSGQWQFYSSLRQAWTAEKDDRIESGVLNRLSQRNTGYLPSGTRFAVAAKTFKIPAEWSARSLSLRLYGVKGKVAVYLNGIDSIHRMSNSVTEGEPVVIDIPMNSVLYAKENIILIEATANPPQSLTLLGLNEPATGQITGDIRLQATVETSLENPKLKVSWDKESAQIQVNFQLVHHGPSEKGPWFVQGVISDGSAEIAQDSVSVPASDSASQPVSLKFKLENVRKWTPEHPFSYPLYISVLNPKGDKDTLALPVALSAVHFVNGKFMRGDTTLAVHGIAVPPEREYSIRESGAIRPWLQEQKSKGKNMLYFLSAFPDEIWLQEADAAGMGIWAELPETIMIPENRLAVQQSWEGIMRRGSWHPSLWAYTAGTGVEVNPTQKTRAYQQSVQKLTEPVPVFMLRLTNFQVADLPGHPYYDQGTINTDWGDVVFSDTSSQRTKDRVFPDWLRWSWLAGVILIFWANIMIKPWRYKELKNRKPKRALRKAWFWRGTALLSRKFTLAGVLTALLFSLELPWSPWVTFLWPLWEIIKLQSPVLIWLILGLVFMLIRLLQIGLAAPSMPESPEPIGLALWLERRNLWNWIVALLWALESVGIKALAPLLAYIGLNILFLPLKIKDVHRIGGKYKAICILPGLFAVVLLGLVASRSSDWLYFGRLLWATYR